MSKPMSLPFFLGDKFNNEELSSIMRELGADPEDFTGGKSSRARQLFDYSNRTDKLDDLLQLATRMASRRHQPAAHRKTVNKSSSPGSHSAQAHTCCV